MNFISLYNFYIGILIYKMYNQPKSNKQTNSEKTNQIRLLTKISLVFVWQTLGAEEGWTLEWMLVTSGIMLVGYIISGLSHVKIPTSYSPVQSPLGMAKPKPITGRSVHSSLHQTHLSGPSHQISHWYLDIRVI